MLALPITKDVYYTRYRKIARFSKVTFTFWETDNT